MEEIELEYIEKGEYAPRKNYPWIKRENLDTIDLFDNHHYMLRKAIDK